ncbi:unnamed protein product [Linum tenue]|uniref:15-cis-phytoene synthase n=1 Tax=Linum tenue TaxID=586396 RepID=A0AAV0M1J0_9ROSI|nr:unnamed protein product [Linum tenue]
MCSVFTLKPCNVAIAAASTITEPSWKRKYASASSQVVTNVATIAPKNRSSLLLKQLGIPHTDLRVEEIVERQSSNKEFYSSGSSSFSTDHELSRKIKPELDGEFLDESYERCREICAEYAKTFYLDRLKLICSDDSSCVWIVVWCRRTDELVDGPNADYMMTNSTVLNRWEERLEDIFVGRAYDMYDAALTHTISQFPLDIKPFRDMIDGMRMDTWKSRYQNFEELYLYCYYVAGTVGLMSVPVMGISPTSSASAQTIYDAALYLGIGNQLTNILRDVGEDRVYLPQDELAQFGLSDRDVMSGKVTDGWREFMKAQITRARSYFNLAEEGASHLDDASRWPVWTALLVYRSILDEIEENDYDNLNKRAYVGRGKKLLMLPIAYSRAQFRPPALLLS